MSYGLNNYSAFKVEKSLLLLGKGSIQISLLPIPGSKIGIGIRIVEV